MTVGQAVVYYQENAPRGEYVLILEGASQTNQAEELDLNAGLDMVDALRSQGKSLKDAVKSVSQDTGLSKNALYEAALRKEEASSSE